MGVSCLISPKKRRVFDSKKVDKSRFSEAMKLLLLAVIGACLVLQGSAKEEKEITEADTINQIVDRLMIYWIVPLAKEMEKDKNDGEICNWELSSKDFSSTYFIDGFYTVLSKFTGSRREVCLTRASITRLVKSIRRYKSK